MQLTYYLVHSSSVSFEGVIKLVYHSIVSEYYSDSNIENKGMGSSYHMCVHCCVWKYRDEVEYFWLCFITFYCDS